MTGYNTTELAHRANDGVEASLRWSPEDSKLVVIVSDARTADSFEVAARPENALDVFYHPYAYAAFRGVHYELAATGCDAGVDALAA